MILIHEFGHFLAARFFGIEVEEFGIGLPPKMLTLFRWKETQFTLNWLPLGGFVRPKGENDPNIAGGLAAANPWKRLGVLIAGPLMNLIAGVLVYSILFTQSGVPSQVRILEVVENSPAAAAGLQTGDIVLSASGRNVTTVDGMRILIRRSLDHPITMNVERNGETVEIVATPLSSRYKEGAMGILMEQVTVPASSWFVSLPASVTATYEQSYEILSLPAQMVRGLLQPEEGRFIGLKGIFDIFNLTVSTDVASRDTTSTTSEQPTYSTLYLIASLTLSIGLFNLLPFPALDGGRIIFTLPELIFRKRVPHQVENAVHAAGMLFLLLLMVYINVMDFVNPIVLPQP